VNGDDLQEKKEKTKKDLLRRLIPFKLICQAKSKSVKTLGIASSQLPSSSNPPFSLFTPVQTTLPSESFHAYSTLRAKSSPSILLPAEIVAVPVISSPLTVRGISARQPNSPCLRNRIKSCSQSRQRMDSCS